MNKITFKMLQIIICVILSCSFLQFDSSAYVTKEFRLHQYQGAPSSDNVMSQSFNFFSENIYLNVTLVDFYRSNNEASVYLYSNVGVSTYASTKISGISVPIALGTQVSASATFINYDYRTYYANGTFVS